MSIQEQFKTFYKEHKPKTMEDALEKFAIFGGVEWDKIDTSKQSFELIKEFILDDYSYIRNDITDQTTGQPLYHSILTAIAMGDGKTNSIYKRAKVTQEVGEKAIETLIEYKILSRKKSKGADDKLVFNTPFMRFWFAFVSPIFQGIRDGNYDEVQTRWENHKTEFTNYIFTELSRSLIKKALKDEILMGVKEFWQNSGISLDIYAQTKEKKNIVGICKYTKSKIKKSELSKLQELTKKVNIDAEIFIIVSKEGFSKELKELKGKNLKLFTLKNFKMLVE